MKLTLQQKREIYCVKHGHSKIVTMYFGYVYCGRCGNQIGDTLGSAFDLKEYVIMGHIKGCKECSVNRKKLSKVDLRILSRLEREEKAKAEKEEKET